jgi:hypothetical protein
MNPDLLPVETVEVVCDQCHALPGDPCTDQHGRPVPLHIARQFAIHQVWGAVRDG